MSRKTAFTSCVVMSLVLAAWLLLFFSSSVAVSTITQQNAEPSESPISVAKQSVITALTEQTAQQTEETPEESIAADSFPCKTGKETEISQFGRQAALASSLKTLCMKHCRPQDRATHLKVDISITNKTAPSFCRRDASTAIPRMDHGCYRNNNSAQFDKFSDASECVTAVFSTLGHRFYGPGGQEYVWESVRQWRLFHPKQDPKVNCFNRVLMITNDTRLADPMMQRNATFFGVELVGHSELMTPEWNFYNRAFYIQGYMHPGGSRITGNKDFNRLVTARFFAIESLMRSRGLTNVVCLENDMMVYTNFAETIKAVTRCGWRMASFFPHFDGVIPGVLFIRSADDLAEFTRFLNELLSCGKRFGKLVQPGYANDMTYLKNFFQLRGGQWMGDLPTALRKRGENCVWDQMPHMLHDGASFGQWYSFAVKQGPPFLLPACSKSQQRDEDHDSAHHVGVKQKQTMPMYTSGCPEWEEPLKKHFASMHEGTPISEEKPPAHIRMAMKKGRFLDATPGELVRWKRDSAGRLFPVWQNEIRLSCLHIHAKNLHWFRSL